MPLPKEFRSLQVHSRLIVYNNVLKIMLMPDFGDRFIAHEETEQDKLCVQYMSKIPLSILRLFVNPIIDKIAAVARNTDDNLSNNYLTLLLAKQPEHLSLLVYGEYFGDVFHFVYTHGQHLISMKLMTDSDAPKPSKILKQVINNMENLEQFELECNKPFIFYCPFFLRKVDNEPMMSGLKSFRMLQVETGLRYSTYTSFAQSICNFLADHPLLETFTFEHDFPILHLFDKAELVMQNMKKLELPCKIADTSDLSTIVKIFPNCEKISLKIDKDSCDVLQKLNLKKLMLCGEFKELPAPQPVEGNDDDSDNDEDLFEQGIDRLERIDAIRENSSNFASIVTPFFKLNDEIRTTILTSLHLTNFHDLDLSLINSSCPELKCFKMSSCTFVNTPDWSDVDVHNLPFKNLEKLSYDVPDAVHLLKGIYIGQYSDAMTFPYAPKENDIKFLLAGAVNVKEIYMKPCVHFSNDVLNAILETNCLKFVQRLELVISCLTIECILDLLSSEEDNFQVVRLPGSIAVEHWRKGNLMEAIRSMDLNIDLMFDSPSDNPLLSFFQRVFTA